MKEKQTARKAICISRIFKHSIWISLAQQPFCIFRENSLHLYTAHCCLLNGRETRGIWQSVDTISQNNKNLNKQINKIIFREIGMTIKLPGSWKNTQQRWILAGCLNFCQLVWKCDDLPNQMSLSVKCNNLQKLGKHAMKSKSLSISD